jgi:hypothetical protein
MIDDNLRVPSESEGNLNINFPSNWNYVAKSFKSKTNEETCLIYCVTWNLKGRIATEDEIKLLLQIKSGKFFHFYAISTQECMRSIFSSFFFDSKDDWIKLIQ